MPNHFPTLLRAPLAVAALLIHAAPARAQDASISESDLPKINLPFVMHFGIGQFEAGTETIRAFSVQGTFKLRQHQPDRLGLRLRFTAVVAAYDFETLRNVSLDQLQTVALLPGLEFQIPVDERITLRPFLDIGPGRALDNGRTFLLSSTGLLTEFVFPIGALELGIEPSLKYSFSVAEGTRFDEDFGDFVLRSDLRRHLPFDIAQYRPVFGIYGQLTNYFEDLVFGTSPLTAVLLTQEYEFGFLFDMQPRIRLWILEIPKVAVGYGFGQGTSGFRIRLGDRVTHLPSYSQAR